MPDLTAGSTVLALDFPPTQTARDATTTTGLTNTTYQVAPSPAAAVAVTFLAPTTGRITLTVWGGLRVSSGSVRAQAGYVLRETDENGTIVSETAGSNPLIGTNTASTSYVYQDGSTLLTGLTPGGVYWAAVSTRTSATGAYDFADRRITVAPAT
jgi:hypothetical protein